MYLYHNIIMCVWGEGEISYYCLTLILALLFRFQCVLLLRLRRYLMSSPIAREHALSECSMTGLVLRSAIDLMTMTITLWGISIFYIVQSFRKGLCNYLKEFSYKNAATGIIIVIIINAYQLRININTEDLWEHLGQASNKPVGEVMSGWTKQLGYPVLSVEGKQVVHDIVW